MRYLLTVIIFALIIYTVVFEGQQYIYVRDLEVQTYREVWRFDYVQVATLCIMAVISLGKSKTKK